MAAFASPAWIESLDEAAASASVDRGLRLTIEQRITGVEPAVWHFVFADGGVTATEGSVSEPTITLTSSLPVAAAIHSGDLSPQRAFLDGDLQIGGDLRVLIETRRALAAFQPDDPRAQRMLATATLRMGFALAAEGEETAALAMCRESVDVRSRLLEADPESGRARRDLATGRLYYAAVVWRRYK